MTKQSYVPTKRISLISHENKIKLDNYSAQVNLSELLSDNIWAVIWQVEAQQGYIEFVDQTPNAVIDNITAFNTMIAKAQQQVQQFIESNQPQPEPVLTFTEQQKFFINQVSYLAQAFIDSIIKDTYPEFEKLTFEQQKTEALAWQQDTNKPTPCLDLLAQARGIERETLIAKVLVKANEFQQLSFYVAGCRQAKEDQAKAATTVAELEQIDLEFSLPV